jgi:hypothetical protein
MSTRAHLAVVPSQPHAERPAERAKRLQAEAKAAALEHIASVEAALSALIEVSAEIGDASDIYPAGVRDLCRRMAEDLSARMQTLESIMSKVA